MRLFRFMTHESRSLVGAATLVGSLSLVSRLIGFVRDRILLGHFGAGDVLDAYYAAFKVPDLLFSLLVVGSLSAGFIPFFTAHYNRTFQQGKAWDFLNNVLNIIAVSMLAISGVLFFFTPQIAELVAPGFDPVKQALVADYTRVMLLAQCLLAVSAMFGGALQSMKRFLLFSLAPIFYNVGIIAGAVWLTPWLGNIGLAWGVVLGAFLHLCVQLYGVLHAGYRYAWRFDVNDAETRGMVKLTGPRIVGIGVTQLNFVLLTILASTLTAGSVTIFQVAYNIQFFPVGIIGIAYAIAVFPTLVDHAERRDMSSFVSSFSDAARQVLFFMVPMTVVFLALRAQVVRVVAGAGAFDWEATILTADTLAFFTLSFAAQSLNALLARAFYALHDTMTPLVAGLVAELMAFVSALAFIGPFGVRGLGMAFTLSAFVNTVLLWVPLRKQTTSLDELHIVRSLFKITVAGLACLLVTQTLKPLFVSVFSLNTFIGVLFQGLFAGGFGLLAYVGVVHVLKSEEWISVRDGITRRFFKKAQPEEAIAPPDVASA